MWKVALGIAAVLTLAAAAACSGGADEAGNSANGGSNGPTPAAQGSDHALGSEQAPVLLVEYADFQ